MYVERSTLREYKYGVTPYLHMLLYVYLKYVCSGLVRIYRVSFFLKKNHSDPFPPFRSCRFDISTINLSISLDVFSTD